MRLDRIRLRLLALASVAAVLGIADTRTVEADIVVSGGSVAQQREIADLYNALPPCCRDTVKICVQIFDGKAMDAYIASGDPDAAKRVNLASVDGIYQNDVPTISLRAESPSAGLCATFAHEYGHYIWQRHLRRADRRDYSKVYDQQKKAHCLVTAYAGDCAEEGFAEAFSYYVVNKPTLAARDSMSCCYLDRMTAGGPCVSSQPAKSP